MPKNLKSSKHNNLAKVREILACKRAENQVSADPNVPAKAKVGSQENIRHLSNAPKSTPCLALLSTLHCSPLTTPMPLNSMCPEVAKSNFKVPTNPFRNNNNNNNNNNSKN
jgi:hypothetical protein